MNDRQIVELYLARNEQAISETSEKYGKYCHYIAYRILGDDGYADEVVNDTYLKTWDSIPPNEPDPLKPYVGAISSRLALDRYDYLKAEKRGANEMTLVYEELEECISLHNGSFADDIALRDAVNGFLAGLSKKKRAIFLRRYWYASSISEIAYDYSMSENSVRTTLSRTRRKFREYLEKGGIRI